jgi:hypothetical protein
MGSNFRVAAVEALVVSLPKLICTIHFGAVAHGFFDKRDRIWGGRGGNLTAQLLRTLAHSVH